MRSAQKFKHVSKKWIKMPKTKSWQQATAPPRHAQWHAFAAHRMGGKGIKTKKQGKIFSHKRMNCHIQRCYNNAENLCPTVLIINNNLRWKLVFVE